MRTLLKAGRFCNEFSIVLKREKRLTCHSRSRYIRYTRKTFRENNLNRAIQTSAALFLLFFVGYNILLVNGGRGPFALYDSFWACHCKDGSAAISDELSRFQSRTGLSVNDLSALSDTSLLVSHSEADICRSGSTGMTENKSCKRKLPLRYTHLLIGNSYMVPANPATLVDHTRGIRILFSFKEESSILQHGHTVSLIKPPSPSLSI